MVTASQVKDLREKTGAGMMDCKKVLTETDGDLEKAAELLREKGITKAAKKSGRVAAEGMVEAYISEDEKVGAIVEVNSETDFVAKNEEFRTFVMDVAKQIVKNNPESVEALLAEPAMFEEGKTVSEALIEKIATGKYQKGDIVEVSFKTRLQVAPNKYTLSFSCTHFKPNGELEVLNRKYDALLVEIISSKEHVGILSLDTKINIEKILKY